MTAKISKKTYYLPEFLTEYFKQWCKPGMGYSTKMAGAMLFYMTLPDDLRRISERLAHTKDIEQAIEQLKSTIQETDDEQLELLWANVEKIAKKMGVKLKK